MFEKESIPYAPALIESMRSIGYSFETAIADLIDNSVSAKAKNIDIITASNNDPKLIIIDDGYGMNQEEIEEAMRYGSKNPLDERNENDLGRFGLGMKSASLSQCRKLIVVSKKNNVMSCFSWDLDYIVENKKWAIVGYSENEINTLPYIEKLKAKNSGTYLLLEEFDRMKESTNNIKETFSKEMSYMMNHLALVFHRFVEAGLKIKINEREIEERDPFLLTNKKTQFRREQRIRIDDEQIVVQPYILPHVSEMTKDDKERLGGVETLRNQQGFYIYRNKRLIIWGTWFRLERKDELNKLARVRVDISNKLDYMWSIDIKKSSANLPDKIKRNLYVAVRDSILNSNSVNEYRGRREKNDDEIEFVWERNYLRDGYEYRINRNIPTILALEETLNKEQINLLNRLINDIEVNIPIDSIYVDASKGNVSNGNRDKTDKEYEEILNNIKYLKDNNKDYMKIIKVFMKSEPYCLNEKLVERLKDLERRYVEGGSING